jgi:NADH-quinone oxidoreductase subunit C
MEPLAIAEALQEHFGEQTILEIRSFRDEVGVVVERRRIAAVCYHMKAQPELCMDFLNDLCGLDFPQREPRFEVVYHLSSLLHHHQLRLKVQVPEDDPTISSVVPVWQAADWFEREVYDMFGIVFLGHPNLKRILMPEDWQGHPLRKDYPLAGTPGWEYPEYEEVKSLHSHDDEWRITGKPTGPGRQHG